MSVQMPMVNQSVPQGGVPAAMSTEQMRQWAELASQLGPLGDEERDIERQQKYADVLRQGKAPQGRQVGNVFVASSPLETLGGLAEKGVGMMGDKELAGQRAGVTGKMKGALLNTAYPQLPEMTPGQFGADVYG